MSDHYRARIERPIFIVSTPRSGSTMLFETMVQAPHLFTVGAESHERIEQVADFFPGARGWTSNRLIADDARPEAVEQLSERFYSVLRDRDGQTPDGRAVRMLEKTPKNALRVPFFASAFPDATFVYLHRPPRPTLASMIEAWAVGRFRTYPRLPDWPGPPWSLLLVPGWRDLAGKPLQEIVAAQWAITTDTLVGDLEALPPERVRVVDYDRFVAEPQPVIERLARSLDLEWDRELGAALRYSRFTVSRPDPEKWRRFEREIEAVMPTVEAPAERAADFVARFG